MARIRCSFKAGNIIAKGAPKVGIRGELRLLGNGWRGLLVVAGAVLWIYGLWELGVLLLGHAFIWSFVENIFRRWKHICARQKVLLALRQGRIEDTMELGGEPEQGTQIWWRLLFLLFTQHRWDQAAQWLEQVEKGKERDYLLAIARLGQNRPADALKLCPPRAEGEWRTLKTEALFKAGEWQKVVGQLRGSSLRGKNKAEALENAWLKGGSYYHLGQYKPAVKLLRQVVEQGGGDYPEAQDWLRTAITKLG
jgi:tetratricopeptide (TPR) repeat protein